MRCWLDAQARANFVVTPVRHVERLADFTDEEVWPHIFQMQIFDCV
jgi:hypothetical protein